jgi:hypothetical protein
MMSLMKKFGLGKLDMLALMAASILFVLIAAPGGYAAENDPGNRALSASLDLPQRPLSVIQQSPVIAAGVRLGTVVLYDDPSTRRMADYLELYDRQGGLVAVSWFDRFGTAVDRAFLDGEERLEGVFVTVVDDDGFI